MTRTINILHISDFHFTRKSEAYNQSVILDAFRDDLKRICDGPLAPDLVVFSGDLVNAADDEDVYLYLYDELLDPISRLTRCSERRFVLCPGNHDAHRNIVKAELRYQQGLATALSNRDALNDDYLSGTLGAYVQRKFFHFRDICHELGVAGSALGDSLVCIDHFDDLLVDVVTANSAWMTWAGEGEHKDWKQLLIPEAAIRNAFKQAKPNHLKLFVTHHPSEWLTEYSESDVAAVIDGAVDVHLYGHMHDPKPARRGYVGLQKNTCEANAVPQTKCTYSSIADRRGEQES
jgi:predicted MPP superfamily phosphohydrolase